jgi:hypothetical protein
MAYITVSGYILPVAWPDYAYFFKYTTMDHFYFANSTRVSWTGARKFKIFNSIQGSTF